MNSAERREARYQRRKAARMEKKAAAQKLKIDEVYLMVACPDGSCYIV